MPESFDMDTEVEGLRSQVGRLKQVQITVNLKLLCFTWLQTEPC